MQAKKVCAHCGKSTCINSDVENQKGGMGQLARGHDAMHAEKNG